MVVLYSVKVVGFEGSPGTSQLEIGECRGPLVVRREPVLSSETGEGVKVYTPEYHIPEKTQTEKF